LSAPCRIQPDLYAPEFRRRRVVDGAPLRNKLVGGRRRRVTMRVITDGLLTTSLGEQDETQPIDVIPQNYSRPAGAGGGLDIRV
jgi:hypothetical protein